MCTKFQVDWTSASSKTTSTKNFNRTDERRHRPENIMPLYYRRWGIKIYVIKIYASLIFILKKACQYLRLLCYRSLSQYLISLKKTLTLTFLRQLHILILKRYIYNLKKIALHYILKY